MRLQGLIWLMNMYLQGECPDYRWTHDNEPPSMQQLAEAIKSLKQPQQTTVQVGQQPCWSASCFCVAEVQSLHHKLKQEK